MLSKAQSKEILAEAVAFSDFFNPQTLLNVFRQKIARNSKLPIDDLKLIVTFDDSL